MTQGRVLTMDGDFWEWLKVSAGAGVTLGTGGGIFVTILLSLRWLATALWGRQDVSHAKLMAILDERDAEIASFREREKAWNDDKVKMTIRIAELEGIDMGIGALRQNEQLVRSVTSRMDRMEKRERGE